MAVQVVTFLQTPGADMLRRQSTPTKSRCLVNQLFSDHYDTLRCSQRSFCRTFVNYRRISYSFLHSRAPSNSHSRSPYLSWLGDFRHGLVAAALPHSLNRLDRNRKTAASSLLIAAREKSVTNHGISFSSAWTRITFSMQSRKTKRLGRCARRKLSPMRGIARKVGLVHR